MNQRFPSIYRIFSLQRWAVTATHQKVGSSNLSKTRYSLQAPATNSISFSQSPICKTFTTCLRGCDTTHRRICLTQSHQCGATGMRLLAEAFELEVSAMTNGIRKLSLLPGFARVAISLVLAPMIIPPVARVWATKPPPPIGSSFAIAYSVRTVPRWPRASAKLAAVVSLWAHYAVKQLIRLQTATDTQQS